MFIPCTCYTVYSIVLAEKKLCICKRCWQFQLTQQEQRLETKGPASSLQRIMVYVLYRSFAGIMFPGNVISQSLPINYLTCHFTSHVSSARPVTDDVFMPVCHWKRKKNISISFPICSLFLLVWIARQIDSAWYQFSGSFSNHHWHTHTCTKFTPWGEYECLRVTQQPPWSVLAEMRGTRHPP